MDRRVLFFVVLPASLLAGYLVFFWLLSWVSGWRRLAASYANETGLEPVAWRYSRGSSTLAWLPVPIGSSLSLRIGADRGALYLRTWPIDFPGFCALRIAWADISVRHRKIPLTRYCGLHFKGHPWIEIDVSENSLGRVVDAAGGKWEKGGAEWPA